MDDTPFRALGDTGLKKKHAKAYEEQAKDKTKIMKTREANECELQKRKMEI